MAEKNNDDNETVSDGGTAESGITDILNGNQETTQTTNNHRSNTNNTSTNTSGETERLGGKTKKKWGGRRKFLAAAGGTAVAGTAVAEAATETSILGYVASFFSTSSSTGETPPPATTKEENSNTPDRELSVPFGGLGAYEEALNEANGLDDADDVTPNQIQNILEGSDTVQEEAEQLAEITYIQDAHSVLQEYHLQKDERDDMVVGNINWSFTSDSEPILELHTVEDGELQGQPIISDTSQGSITTHKPNDGPNPQYLQNIRNDDRWSSTVPQDYDAFTDRYEDASEETIRASREVLFNHWSNGLFGMDEQPNIIPHDAESSNVVFDGLYHGENTEAVVQLNQQYAESGLTDTDEVVSAQYTGEGWEFEVQEDYEMGDELPALQ